MPCCVTGRNIQKYKGAGGTASTLQDALENDNVATIDIILQSPAKFVGDGSGLFGIPGVGGSVGNLQQVTDVNSTSTNKIILTNTATSLQTYGNIVVGTNVYASEYFGDGTKLSGIALNTELADNVIRIGNLETNLTNNSTRITTVTNNLTNNVIRIGNLETNLTSNSSRISTLETEIQPVNRGGTGLTSFVSGDLIYANGTSSFTNLAASSSTQGYFLKNDNGIPTWADVSLVGSASPYSITAGSGLSGGNYNGSSAVTWTVDFNVVATTSNLNSNVARINTLENEIQPVNRGGTGLTSYTVGDLLYAVGPTTLSVLSAGNNGEVLTMSSGLPSWAVASGGSGGGYWTQSGSSIYYTNGNVGIGTTNPNYKLHVAGTSNFTNAIYANGSAGTSGQVLTSGGAGSAPTWTTVSGGGGGGYWTQTGSGSNIYYTLGNVGIGTMNPNYKLDVTGTSNFTGEMRVNGSVGTSGQVLTSSGAGSAPTWTTVSGGGGGSSYWTQSGLNIYYTTGNVGIANTAPTNTLDIGSNVSVIDDGVDKLVIRGNVYSTHDIIATSFRGDGSNLTGVTASSITSEASRTISISTVNVLSAAWLRT
jgi:hypothetical protein